MPWPRSLPGSPCTCSPAGTEKTEWCPTGASDRKRDHLDRAPPGRIIPIADCPRPVLACTLSRSFAGAVHMGRRWVMLTAGNFSDHFPPDYPRALVAGLKIGEGGINQDAPQVGDFLAWVAGQGTPDTEYFCNRFEASLILGRAAGARPD